MKHEGPFASLLRDSFAVLAAEVPEILAEFRAALAGRQVELAVDDERVGLRVERHAIHWQPVLAPHVRVVTKRREIFALVDAASTLRDSVLADRLTLFGATAELLRFHEALMLYLHGAYRAPSMPQVLRRFRLHTPSAHVADL